MKDREKIIKIVQPYISAWGADESLADALIENDIGDVEEWKRKAEVAERALIYAVCEYRCDECPCLDCNAEIRGSQECVDLIAKTYKKQAAREIEVEEQK